MKIENRMILTNENDTNIELKEKIKRIDQNENETSLIIIFSPKGLEGYNIKNIEIAIIADNFIDGFLNMIQASGRVNRGRNIGILGLGHAFFINSGYWIQIKTIFLSIFNTKSNFS